MAKKKKRTQIPATLFEEQIKNMDKLVDEGTYSNRSHFLREAVKDKINEELGR